MPINHEDIESGRALRTALARFWSTEQGEPRDIYDRFISATTVALAVSVQPVDDSSLGIWVRPDNAVPGRALLFLHGGAYGLGSAAAYVGFASQLATRSHAATLVLDYPLAPESQLPEALDLAVTTLSRLGRDHTSVALAGDSAGGGLALSVAARAAHEGHAIAAIAAFSPWTDLTLSGASVQEQAIGDPVLDAADLRAAAAAYLGSAAPDDPRASPLFGQKNLHTPLLIQVGSDEILLDDSKRFAASIEEAGGSVRLEVWQGMHHVFQVHVAQLISARNALDRAGDFLSNHMKQ